MSSKLAWGILGTGRIAGVFAKGLANSETGTLVAVGSRSQEAADAFGAQWSVERCYGSYEELLADEQVQAVYIATPHPQHAQWAIRAAEAGKHILCEKPIALNHAEAMAIVEAAQRHQVFLMEAFMYRCHPQTQMLRELLQAGTIGDIRVIQATFSFNAGFNPESRLYNNALGGGGILDVGCYSVSMARMIAGIANGKDFVEPTQVSAVGQVGSTGVDEYTVASLSFPGGVLAQLFTGIQVNGDNNVRIFGSKGSITIQSPWLPERGQAYLLVEKNGQSEKIDVESEVDLYGNEADTVATYLEQLQAPAMSWEDTLGNMQTLDRWRKAIGVVYEAEKPEGKTLTVSQRPLRVRSDASMKYGNLPGVEKPVSRLVMGVDNQTEWPHASVMLDDYFERGGNCFDTAFIYGGGACEKLLGQWIANRGIREQVVILGKGAHTPYCTPEWIVKQLDISLGRLRTDYVDIYMMHRDNPEIPVGEFITVLNEQKKAGRIRVFGASNWSIERLQEANQWAAEHGLTGFSALSNNFSLARMIDPVWAGCISASDASSRAWLTEHNMALMPWSSQARGFFTGRAKPEDHSDPELVRCWYSEDNFQRLERVNQMARERGILPITLALAYVLNQPFPTFPLIGPRALSETRTSFEAVNITLTPEEVRWLNLEA
ncbi:aldo/keto reductase [Ktedonobacter racemifer]|uniref:Oxidoreductase domain protein n=1 Tax=Ktedonobacter racemifer DSM 44963 TaxID=485913 RepID=D6U067_KTERA|nr:aldo/keto reductase [Ktedonobacter racemifer]EFH82207.1 oxidoreductase domain protein [Ktedonobacter racemifer DSM 44963]